MFVTGILLEDVHVDDGLTHGSYLSISPTEALAGCLGNNEVHSTEEVLHLHGGFLQDA